MLKSLDDIKAVSLNNIPDNTGSLLVVEEGNGIAIDIKRLFLVSDVKGAERGHHAHKECTQVMICISGACEVICDDGVGGRRVLLRGDSNKGLQVPPSIWASLKYVESGTTVLVICDRLYDENDYIRSYVDFQRYRKHHALEAAVQ